MSDESRNKKKKTRNRGIILSKRRESKGGSIVARMSGWETGTLAGKVAGRTVPVCSTGIIHTTIRTTNDDSTMRKAYCAAKVNSQRKNIV